MEAKIQELIKRLEAIAKKNGDEFEYRIRLEPPPRQGLSGRKALVYRFEAIETADHHAFLDGFGNSIAEAVEAAENGVSEACKHWGYEE
jgi:hypothetical protein